MKIGMLGAGDIARRVAKYALEQGHGEARLLAENAMRFNIASTLVRGQITQIKEAIQDGKS